MKFDIVTIFPRMVRALLLEGLIARAVEKKLLDVVVHDLREFTADRHRSVDDVPYGGGPGMVMKAEPFIRAVQHLRRHRGLPDAVILTSPQGKPLTHKEAVRLSTLEHVVLLCGRYEGVDERVCEEVVTEEISIGDYVVTGGELPAMVIVDAVGRHVSGVVGDSASVESDSFARSLLDWPHYTRPEKLGSNTVPEVLLSGNHLEIQRWRKRAALQRTLQRRPELLGSAQGMDDEEREVLQQLQRNEGLRKAGA